jgi:hypothetical protein
MKQAFRYSLEVKSSSSNEKQQLSNKSTEEKLKEGGVPIAPIITKQALPTFQQIPSFLHPRPSGLLQEPSRWINDHSAFVSLSFAERSQKLQQQQQRHALLMRRPEQSPRFHLDSPHYPPGLCDRDYLLQASATLGPIAAPFSLGGDATLVDFPYSQVPITSSYLRRPAAYSNLQRNSFIFNRESS